MNSNINPNPNINKPQTINKSQKFSYGKQGIKISGDYSLINFRILVYRPGVLVAILFALTTILIPQIETFI